ncbi:MAG TPA: alpha-hydroxy-acid oxidizing enzyme, partial [Cytophagales bacterium]|nr:alpha-hydroxy-acid oxidizing enzyme [Cytophagales bacterium]
LLDDPLITKASQALNVFDFRKVAQAKLSTAHFGYLETGVLDDWTLLANEKAFRKVKLRMRRLLDMSDVDTSASLFGESWTSPIMLCPCGSQKAFHADGEIATARAAKTTNSLQMLSTMSTSSIEEVTAAKGSPVWFQLYPSKHWEDTIAMVERAEKSGSKVIGLTVDSNYQDRRETYLRAARLDGGNCQTCHGQRNATNYVRNKPMIRELSQPFRLQVPLTWDFVKQLREATSLKLILKGIVSGEDSRRALDHGVDALMVS